MSHHETLGVFPPISPGDIKWSWHLADPAKPDQTAIEMPLAVPLRSRVRILEEDNARLKTELDRHPWARRMVR